MIYESVPWKRQLIRDADLLERWSPKESSDRRTYLLESKVFNGAYAMRKLAHSYKLSSSFDDRNVPCKRYTSTKPMTWMDRWQYWDHFDMATPTIACINGLQLIDMIIHSYVFEQFYEDEASLETNFIVTSDWKRNTHLWQFKLPDFAALMRVAGNDYPSEIRMSFSRDEKDWRMWRGNGQPHADTGREAGKAQEDEG